MQVFFHSIRSAPYFEDLLWPVSTELHIVTQRVHSRFSESFPLLRQSTLLPDCAGRNLLWRCLHEIQRQSYGGIPHEVLGWFDGFEDGEE